MISILKIIWRFQIITQITVACPPICFFLYFCLCQKNNKVIPFFVINSWKLSLSLDIFLVLTGFNINIKIVLFIWNCLLIYVFMFCLNHRSLKNCPGFHSFLMLSTKQYFRITITCLPSRTPCQTFKLSSNLLQCWLLVHASECFLIYYSLWNTPFLLAEVILRRVCSTWMSIEFRFN